MKQDILVTEKMKIAGRDMASSLTDAKVSCSMGGLGGSLPWTEWLNRFNGDNKDLIIAYVNNEIDSITAIYLAMGRARNEST
jgi:hypothetical protein